MSKIVHNLLCQKCWKSRNFFGRISARIFCSRKVYGVFHVCSREEGPILEVRKISFSWDATKCYLWENGPYVLFNNILFMSKRNNKVLGILLQNFFFFFYWKDHCDIGKPLLVVVRCFLNKFVAGEFFITRIRCANKSSLPNPCFKL